MLVREKLDHLLDRHSVIEAEMAANPDPETYVKLASEYSELEPIVSKIREYFSADSDLGGVQEILDDRETDRKSVV